jgi:hypothetical protein
MIKEFDVKCLEFVLFLTDILAVQSYFSFVKNYYHVIRMVSTLHPGLYVVKMVFKGLFHTENVGLYRQSFTRPNGQKV